MSPAVSEAMRPDDRAKWACWAGSWCWHAVVLTGRLNGRLPITAASFWQVPERVDPQWAPGSLSAWAGEGIV